MPPLAELQKSFARAVLTGAAPALAFVLGSIPAAMAMQVHRNTVLGALTHALRLSHHTVEALVGLDFFDHIAGRFAEAHPRSPPGWRAMAQALRVFFIPKYHHYLIWVMWRGWIGRWTRR